MSSSDNYRMFADAICATPMPANTRRSLINNFLIRVAADNPRLRPRSFRAVATPVFRIRPEPIIGFLPPVDPMEARSFNPFEAPEPVRSNSASGRIEER